MGTTIDTFLKNKYLEIYQIALLIIHKISHEIEQHYKFTLKKFILIIYRYFSNLANNNEPYMESKHNLIMQLKNMINNKDLYILSIIFDIILMNNIIDESEEINEYKIKIYEMKKYILILQPSFSI